MSERDFSKGADRPEKKENHIVRLAGRLLFYTGIVIIISGLVYMFFNLNRSDIIFHLWLPYIITGIAMVCISLLLKMPFNLPRRHNR